MKTYLDRPPSVPSIGSVRGIPFADAQDFAGQIKRSFSMGCGIGHAAGLYPPMLRPRGHSAAARIQSAGSPAVQAQRAWREDIVPRMNRPVQYVGTALSYADAVRNAVPFLPFLTDDQVLTLAGFACSHPDPTVFWGEMDALVAALPQMDMARQAGIVGRICATQDPGRLRVALTMLAHQPALGPLALRYCGDAAMRLHAQGEDAEAA